jgi:mycothiol synthase
MTKTPLPAGLTTRPLTPADLDDVYAVYAADEVADAGHLAIEPEDLAGDWSRPSFDLAHDSIGVFEDGHVVAAAEVTRGGTRAEGAVHPDVRGRGIGSWLVDWTESRARAHGAATVGQNTPDGSMSQRLLLARGYQLGHTSWVLGLQEAFGEWHGRERETYEDWAATTVRRPGTQPWQLRVVEHEGVVVGASFTILDMQGTGYVHQLAVDRRHRGRGLAQAMLADAFERAREEGATHSELSTDSRTGALDLYRKVGMEVTQTWTYLVTDLLPA